MKKLLWIVACIFGAVSGWAAGNNITMVSYFPIPYASYNDLKVTNTCDVGLLDKCQMDFGTLRVDSTTASVPNTALNTGTFNVKSGNLSLLTSQPINNNYYLGVGRLSGTALSEGDAKFRVGGDLTVNGSFLDGENITSLVSTGQTTLYGLKLKNKDNSYLEFEECDATDNEINWTKITVDGAEGVYLTCGKAEIGCTANPNQEKCCTSDETWDGTRCVQSCAKNPNQAKCCASDETWNGTYCMQTCRAYEPETFYYMYYNRWYSAGSSLSAGEDMGGTCGGNYTVPDSYPSGTGVTHLGACREMGDACDGYGSCGNYNIGPETVWSLRCENQADEQGYTLDKGEAANFGCAFKLEYASTTSSEPYCWTGYLVCKYNTWQCRANQTCGSTKGVCN